MHRLNKLAVVIWLTFGPGVVFATDLAKIERVLKKEPIYQSKTPQYGLLVFGPKANFRIWLVLDGDNLYVDRNGNGDLTEAGEQVRCAKADGTGPSVGRWFDVGDITMPGEKERYPRLVVCSLLLSKEGQADFHYCRIWVETLACQHGACRLAAKRQEAPILPFAGPLVMLLAGDDSFIRGQDCEVRANVGAVGVGTSLRPGKGVVTTHFCQPFKSLEKIPAISTKSIPSEVHPVAHIEFPNKEPGGDPLRLRINLSRRC